MRVDPSIKAFLSHYGDGCIGVDEKQTVCFWNASASHLFNIPEAEACGRPLAYLVSVEEGAATWDEVLKPSDRGEKDFLLLASKKPCARQVWADMRVVECQWEDDHPGFLLFVRDVTPYRETQLRAEHLNSVLMGIRNVNQLITQEQDEKSLICKACASMIQRLGYYNAWIAELDHGNEPVRVGSAGFEGAFEPMRHRLERGQYSACMKRALSRSAVEVIPEPETECADCPLSRDYHGRAGMVRRLEHDGQVFGVLAVSVPRAFAFDEMAQELFAEVSGDLGFALHKIAEQKKTHRLQQVVDALPNPISLLSRDYRYLAVNRAYERLFQTTNSEMAGREIRDFLGDELFETAVRPRLERCLAGESVTFETQVDFPGEGKRWLEMRFIPLLDRDRGISCVASHGMDITHRKRAEQALARSEEQLKMVMDGAELGTWDWHVPSGHVTFNERWAAMLGMDLSQVEGHVNSWQTLVHPEDMPDVQKTLEAHLRGETESYETEHRMKHRDGHWIWVQDRGRVMERDVQGNPVRACGIHQDITERRCREDALRMHSLAMAQIQDLVTVTDMNGIITFVNDATCRSLGRHREELVGQSIAILGEDPDSGASQREILERTLNHGAWRGEVTNLDKLGNPLILDCRVQMVRDAQGQAVALCGISTDITQRKHSEHHLLRQQRIISLNHGIAQVFLTSNLEDLYDRMLELLLESLGCEHGFVGVVDDEGQLVCPTLTQGVWMGEKRLSTPVIVPVDRWGGLWGRALKEKCVCMTHEALNTPAGHLPLNNALAVPLVHRGEAIGIFVLANKHDGFDEDDQELLTAAAAQAAPILFGMLKAESQEKAREKLEQQMHQAQKLESIGRLAGGVAHDFNNMLGAILTRAELALDHTLPQDPVHGHLEEIKKAAWRSADLTRQLLAFARRQTVAPKVINLNTAIEGIMAMLRRLIGEDVAVAWRPGSGMWCVEMDPSQLDQILTNLCVNARDAIEGTGSIEIETHKVEIRSSELGDLPAGEYVKLTVSDDGSGMDEEILEHLFEPFFTTKGLHEGTGLGLATVYGIVEQNQGRIAVESQPGMGSRFHIYLPRCIEDEALQPAAELSPPTGKGERVLFVEDDESMLEPLVEALKALGYEVLAARTPGQALRLSRDCTDSIQLLLTDVVMPEMNGRDLAERLCAARPGLPCLFMSGYTGDVISHRGKLASGVAFIQKPFSIRELASKLREVLDENRN